MPSARYFTRLAALIGLTLGTLSVAHARLGHTLKQCIDRFGEPVRKIPSSLPGADEEACVFARDNIEFIYHFQDQRAWHIAITAKQLSPLQQKQFLEENTDANNVWMPPLGEKSGTLRIWITPGGHQWAALTEFPGMMSLEIMTRKAAEALTRQREIRTKQAK